MRVFKRFWGDFSVELGENFFRMSDVCLYTPQRHAQKEREREE